MLGFQATLKTTSFTRSDTGRKSFKKNAFRFPDLALRQPPLRGLIRINAANRSKDMLGFQDLTLRRPPLRGLIRINVANRSKDMLGFQDLTLRQPPLRGLMRHLSKSFKIIVTFIQ
ncbi:hypothetical protein AVEN_177277-1 [Araneus ventricosus]|uniref:Uncharacterized protein n=1 Tax=Araneus ventricosus TaxID=182803 RepID=A0A4Y2L470_ARAVE|nr:hypothetical protein AVEN_177277-1 [Araneus ventricosus]